MARFAACAAEDRKGMRGHLALLHHLLSVLTGKPKSPAKWDTISCDRIKRKNQGQPAAMSATIFDSKPLATRMAETLKSEAAQFRKQRHRSARITQVIVGHDAAAEVYSRQL